MPHTFAFIDLHSWGGVGNGANYMNYYQIHAISGLSVNLLDIPKRKNRDGLLSIVDDTILLTFSPDEKELIKGDYTNYNNLAPVTVGGAPYVFSDNDRNLISPMEDHLEPISDVRLLERGHYLITV